MPELPEVETVRRGLERLLIGKSIARVSFDWKKSFPNAQSDVDRVVVGASVVAVRRRAKVLLVDLSSGYTLVTHLKMTGQLVYRGVQERFGAGHPNDSLVGDLPDKSTRIQMHYTDGSVLFFNDQRKFGWMKLVATSDIDALDFFRRVGPEPLAHDFTTQDFITRVRRRSNSGIKAVLLDQTVIAGVGNIYADESLWGAGIHPSTMVRYISERELETLYTVLRDVLLLSIEKGGSTDRNYVNAKGERGSYLSFARVFRRQGKPCERCDVEIIKVRVAGRGTHICPRCQVKTP